MKFRKKPVEIEAQQFLEGQPIPNGVCFGWSCGDRGSYAHVHTIHDNQRVFLDFGDWVISEPDGEHFYPCKPDIFDASYEAINE